MGFGCWGGGGLHTSVTGTKYLFDVDCRNERPCNCGRNKAFRGGGVIKIEILNLLKRNEIINPTITTLFCII